jgi:hypothetical protein
MPKRIRARARRHPSVARDAARRAESDRIIAWAENRLKQRLRPLPTKKPH